MNENYSAEWNASYARGDNFLYYPNEYVIRFVARFLRKQVGLHDYHTVASGLRAPIPLLDLGCGAGRHVVFAYQMGMCPSGIDLSHYAVQLAKSWALEVGGAELTRRIVQGDIRKLPWDEGTFDVVISHGVLDSMPATVAEAAVEEAARVLAAGGLFYVDLISGDDSRHCREFAGDEEVLTTHETGTIQSYFNFGRIERTFSPRFEFVEITLVKQESVLACGYKSRYHCVMRKRA